MTANTQPLAPTDAEIDAVLCSNWPAFYRQATLVRMWLRDAVREAIAKWGQPAHSGEPVAWLDPWTGAKVTTDYDAYGKHGIPLYTAPQPQPTSRGDALDAARYRYLRDVPMELWPAELLSAIRLQQNAKWDAAIDAARAAQEGSSHG